MSNSANNKVYQVDIPLKLDTDSVIRCLTFRGPNSRLEDIAREITEKVREVARPRAIYMISQAHCIDRDTVEVDGVKLHSRILSRLFDTSETVYPFIATVGKELDELPLPAKDMWRRLCLDTIKTVVLVSGVDYLSEYLKDKYSIAQTAHMNPGELDDWPITQQEVLFSLFNGAEKRIGVTLTRGGAMKPIKSRSGILFPDDTDFLSCRLCTQEQCPGRRAAYEPELVKEYLG